MDKLFAIACAFAEGGAGLAPDCEVTLALDDHRAAHLLREPVYGDLVVSVSEQALGRTPEEEGAAREALLRLGHDTRMTGAWIGALDEDGRERIVARPVLPLDAQWLDAQLAALLRQLSGADQAATSAAEHP